MIVQRRKTFEKNKPQSSSSLLIPDPPSSEWLLCGHRQAGCCWIFSSTTTTTTTRSCPPPARTLGSYRNRSRKNKPVGLRRTVLKLSWLAERLVMVLSPVCHRRNLTGHTNLLLLYFSININNMLVTAAVNTSFRLTIRRRFSLLLLLPNNIYRHILQTLYYIYIYIYLPICIRTYVLHTTCIYFHLLLKFSGPLKSENYRYDAILPRPAKCDQSRAMYHSFT